MQTLPNQTELELGEPEKRFRFMADAMPLIVWTAQPDGNLDYYNRHWYEYTGLTFEQTKNWGWQPVLHPDDLQNCIDRWTNSFTTGENYEVEYRFRRASDGGYRWHLGRAHPMRDEAGEITMWVGTCTDIDDRKRTEEELLQLGANLERKVEETTSELSVVVAARRRVEAEALVTSEILEGVSTTSNLNELLALAHRAIKKILYAENCFVALYDERAELLDMQFFVDKYDSACKPQKLGKGLTSYIFRSARPMLLTGEMIRRLTDKGEVDLLGTPPAILLGVPLRTPAEIIGVLVVQHYEDESAYNSRDLELLSTVGSPLALAIERKRAEDWRAVLASIVESSEDAIMSKTLEGVITSWNSGAKRIFGYPAKEIVGRNIALLFPPERLYEEPQIVERIKRGERIEHYETVRVCKDGRHIPVSLTVSPVKDSNGGIVGISKIVRDITAQKQVEIELNEARDDALESARMKSEFLANMSHEIRTPMNGVIGMTGLLLDTDLTDEQREFTETVRSSGDALLKIIDDILDFSKIEAGQMRFEKIDFDLIEAVESSVGLLAERAQAKDVEMASIVYSDVPSSLMGDPGRLRQVLMNLVGNAVKFTERGEVAVSVRKQKETGDYVVLRFNIADTGIGISDEARRRLFHAFTQADGSTTRKYGGTGLGLAISKQLVEMMGGEIGVESAPGRGSTFWFTARFEKQSPPASSSPVANLDGARVLIVDDNRTNRRIFLHQTASWGMIPAEADSGKAALRLLRSAAAKGEPFDVAILDLMMPEMDGFDLARRIKSDASLASVALVLLSFSGKSGRGQTARETGIAAYLQKPVRQSQLYNCLTTVVGERGKSENTAPERVITRHTLREEDSQRKNKSARPGVRILLAEDNTVNQKVALSQLKNLGYDADVAANGREAVEAVGKNGYDIVLMDCQMPEMDGFEATAEIRRLQDDAKPPVIIAMTAHALEGEREKCLAAGMDDYLSKPVKAESLRRTIERWTLLPAYSASPAIVDSEDFFEIDKLEILNHSVLESFGEYGQPGETDLVIELIDLFIDDAGKRLASLRRAVAERDASAIKREAHGLKGSSGNVGARRAAAIFKRMEASADDIDRMKILLEKLEIEFSRTIAALASMRWKREL
ncbi:MAG TPA: PAS domain S-box protein [Pyrinomonadaceae bacterium]|nr:PAS domain S-box protein [Pyrinomonadaceae bacterium]